jgi:hypothetical protein
MSRRSNISRRLKILDHLMQAQVHHNKAMQLLLEDGAEEELTLSPTQPSIPPAPHVPRPATSEAPRERFPSLSDPVVDTLTTSLAVPEEVRRESAARERAISRRPTAYHPAFTRETALVELKRAWDEATNDMQRARVAAKAKQLVAASLLDEEDVKEFEAKSG